MINRRTGLILNMIVNQYIDNAVPVPSQHLVNLGDFSVSSATIRNEMVRLEKDGYIARPYSSSGSVPTDKGYRFYVESLPQAVLTPETQRLINHLFHQIEGKMDEWLDLAASLMSQLVKNVAIVSRPKGADCRFKHLELLSLEETRVLLVLVLRGAKIKQEVITLEPAVSQASLSLVANKVSAAFNGLTCNEIESLELGLTTVEKAIEECVVQIMKAEDEAESDDTLLNGWHFMLNQPEFSHSERMQVLMEMVEKRNLLKSIVPRDLQLDEVRVVIGEENQESNIRDYSVVVSRYGLPDEIMGTIAIVGPTRMQYARAISAVGHLSWLLTGLICELYGKSGYNPQSDGTNE